MQPPAHLPSFDAQPSFRFFPVSSPLERYVQYLFTSRVPKDFSDVIVAGRLPEVEPQLVFAIEEGRAFPDAIPIGGGRSASLFVQPAHLHIITISMTIRETVGAALSPAGLRLLLPAGAGDLSSAPLISLEAFWGPAARTLRDRLVAAGTPARRLALLRSALDQRARAATATSPSVLRAVHLLEAAHGALAVEALAKSCGVTSRTLRNLLLSETGMTPKHLARIIRLRRAIALLRQGREPLDAADLDSGFADQAHMCREFSALLRQTPRALMRSFQASPQDMPRLTSERDLVATGLLVVPRAPTPEARPG